MSSALQIELLKPMETGRDLQEGKYLTCDDFNIKNKDFTFLATRLSDI